mgnify:FL=1
MKKFELMVVLGKTMEKNGVDSHIINGLGLEYTMNMKDSMNEEIAKDEKETMNLLAGLLGDNPELVNYWIGVAIKTLAMSSKS